MTTVYIIQSGSPDVGLLLGACFQYPPFHYLRTTMFKIYKGRQQQECPTWQPTSCNWEVSGSYPNAKLVANGMNLNELAADTFLFEEIKQF